LGAIGLDLNPNQLVLAELDRCGNFQGGEHIPCITYGKRREHAKAMVGDAVKQVMAVAVRSRKPLVIERLEFCEKEGSSRKCGKRTSPPAFELCLPASYSVPASGGVSGGSRGPRGQSRLYLHYRSGKPRGSFWDQHSSGRSDCDRP
jgi:hypothetical protein